MTTVATHLVEALVHAGVRRIYGVVGDSLNSIVDAVHHSDSGVVSEESQNRPIGYPRRAARTKV
jgi:thiamine pyrophosphate-dependent acetolactate synthase large subunit-like protein